ncbi:C40 family peptidase [Microbispora hainanensis]|uniref:C40 family peptidase n=1 Tax=Microbispora hainanensis TaxID=568844 RepID=UPI0033DE6F07
MIAELGAGKFIAAGGCLVCGVVVIAAIGGGAKYAFTAAETAKLRAAICAYAAPPDAVRQVPAARFGLSSQQIANAQKIVNVAAKLGLPKRAAEVALGTAIQESSLTNLRTGTGSYGLFQQQPSQGWGTKQQVTDPSHAARSFYTRLVEIPGWEHMPLTQAAALVQRPREDLRDAYAKHEPRAKALVALLWKGGSPRRAAVDTAASDDMRVSVQTAAGLSVPRDELVASIAADLAGKESGERTDPEEIRKRADDIVTTVAGRLCKELKVRADDPADATTSDGNALIVSPAARGAIAVRAALGMIGVPYSWGGGGPDGPSFGTGRGAMTKGFDCSGLTEYAWSKAGVSIGSSTGPQWHSGKHVDRSQLQPGDLVFFAYNPRNPGTIHHVGLYIGKGKMVHAPHTGSHVQIAPMSRSDYAGAVRPL